MVSVWNLFGGRGQGRWSAGKSLTEGLGEWGVGEKDVYCVYVTCNVDLWSVLTLAASV